MLSQTVSCCVCVRVRVCVYVLLSSLSYSAFNLFFVHTEREELDQELSPVLSQGNI